jgi:hypothetical protein
MNNVDEEATWDTLINKQKKRNGYRFLGIKRLDRRFQGKSHRYKVAWSSIKAPCDEFLRAFTTTSTEIKSNTIKGYLKLIKFRESYKHCWAQ